MRRGRSSRLVRIAQSRRSADPESSARPAPTRRSNARTRAAIPGAAATRPTSAARARPRSPDSRRRPCRPATEFGTPLCAATCTPSPIVRWPAAPDLAAHLHAAAESWSSRRSRPGRRGSCARRPRSCGRPCTRLSILAPRRIDRRLERGAVDRGVGADLDVVLDDTRCRLCGILTGARRPRREAEPVGADHHARMQDDAVADAHVLAHDHAGVRATKSRPICTPG